MAARERETSSLQVLHKETDGDREMRSREESRSRSTGGAHFPLSLSSNYANEAADVFVTMSATRGQEASVARIEELDT